MRVSRVTALTEAARARPSRRGTFALEPVEAMPRYAEGIARLAERAVEANPFFLPEFLEPAIRALRPRRLKLAIFSDQSEVLFFAPVRATGGLVRGAKLRVWTHPYAPLGTPLIARAAADQVAARLISHLDESGGRLLVVPDLPLSGAAARVLRAAAARQSFWAIAGAATRPILRADDPAGLLAFETMLTPEHRRGLEQQSMELLEIGPVSLMTARAPGEIEAALTIFAALEASGAKSRRGAALNRSGRIAGFARAAILRLAATGRVAIDVMRAGETPVAALIRLDQGDLAVPWKLACDRSFAAYAPDAQILCDATRRWLADPAIRRADSLWGQHDALLMRLWSDRERFGTLLIGPSRWAVRARLGAGLISLGHSLPGNSRRKQRRRADQRRDEDQ